jgi:4'-phosphopantetheinyl transferase
MIVFGVAQGLELGVDVENSDRRKASLAIAARYFAPSEVVQLSALSADEQANRFFEFWTLKESYIKARGMGLSIPLDKFCFDLSTNCIAFTVQQELQDEPERWKFWQFRSNPRYQIAVCAAQSPVLSPHLIVSQTIPLVSEQRIAVKYARESQ